MRRLCIDALRQQRGCFTCRTNPQLASLMSRGATIVRASLRSVVPRLWKLRLCRQVVVLSLGAAHGWPCCQVGWHKERIGGDGRADLSPSQSATSCRAIWIRHRSCMPCSPSHDQCFRAPASSVSQKHHSVRAGAASRRQCSNSGVSGEVRLVLRGMLRASRHLDCRC